MDPAPAIGIGGGFAVVIAANVMEGGNPMSLLLGPPLLLVFGTSILVSMAGGTMSDAKAVPAAIMRAFTGKVEPASAMIPDVAEVAVEVVDSWHRRGVGSLLIRALVSRAVDLRVGELAAVMAHDNRAARRLLGHVPGELGQVPGTTGVAEYRLVLRPAC
jgi:GNAT superfamily N-acetyltransferase